MKKKKGEFSELHVLRQIGPDTRKALIKNRWKITQDTGKMKYTRNNPKMKLLFKKGHDLLQFLIAVKPFIMKCYSIEKEVHLDVLLYLFPIQYFTMKDFKLLPLKNTGCNLKNMIEMGYIVYVPEQAKGESKVFTLSEKSVRIVKDFYSYLSGEKKLNSKESKLNPFKDPEATILDQQREKLMLDIKQRFENWPNLFRKGLF